MTTVPVTMNGHATLQLLEHRKVAGWETEYGWEPERVESMVANLRPGMVVVDVGAEEGDMSALCATIVSTPTVAEPDPSGGGVVLVEASTRYWPNMRATFEANGLAPLACWHGFAGELDQNVVGRDLLARGAWPLASTGPIALEPGFASLADSRLNGYDLPTITLDTLAEVTGLRFDAITCDVEGAEYVVFQGAQRVLAEHRPLVWVSVHAESLFGDWRVYQSQFHSLLHQQGYEKRFLAFDHEQHWFYWPAERRDEVILP